MNANTHTLASHSLPRLDVSAALEIGSPTPLSTYWIPLQELVLHWTEQDVLLLPAPVAPLLTAIGHALFALSHETRALRLYTLAWQQHKWQAPALVIAGRAGQATGHLHDAAHHWSRAAFTLDSLLPTDLEASALARARQLSRIARTQQERLWALIEEVQADVQVWCPPPQQEPPRAQQEEASV